MPVGTPSRNDSKEAVFGAFLVAEETPVVQLQFPYNINPALIKTVTTNLGSVDAVDSIAELTTGAASNSKSIMLSKRSAPYNAGQGQAAKFSALFSTGVEGNEQTMGVGDLSDAYQIGMIGTKFAVRRRHGGRAEVRTLEITSSATATGNITITIDGTPVVIPIVSGDTIGEIAWTITQVDYINIDGGWEAIYDGDAIHFRSLTNGAKTGTFSFVDTDTTGVTATFVQDVIGVDHIDDTVYQEDFNQNKVSWLDPTKGNVFRIRYQWLGFGKILFEVEQPKLGIFIPMHIMTYANENLLPSSQNPTLPICAENINTTNTTDVKFSTASAAIFVEGRVKPVEVLHSEVVEEVSVSTTEVPLISLHNEVNFAGKPNRVIAKVELISFVTDGAQNVFFTISRGNKLIGPVNMVHHDEPESVMEVDTSATGIEITDQDINTGLGKVDSRSLIFDDIINLFILTGEILTISAHTTNGTNANVSLSITWKELF
jgi:hypothetical protein